MKISKILIILALFSLSAYAPNILAVKMIPFEDPELQPMPPVPGIRPNISGSVNSNPDSSKTKETQNLDFTAPVEVSKNSPDSNSNSSFPYLMIWIAVAPFIAGLIVLGFIFLRSKKGYK